MKIYYAHHLWKYGTNIEIFEEDCIQRSFPNAEIVNPHYVLNQDQDESEVMKAAYQAIDECECLVFSTVSGVVGQGVFNEIIYALNHGKHVYQLIGLECYEIHSEEKFHFDIIKNVVFNGDPHIYATLYAPNLYQDSIE